MLQKGMSSGICRNIFTLDTILENSILFVVTKQLIWVRCLNEHSFREPGMDLVESSGLTVRSSRSCRLSFGSVREQVRLDELLKRFNSKNHKIKLTLPGRTNP